MNDAPSSPPITPLPPATTGWQLRLWRVLRRPLQPVMRQILARRLKAGKEDPARMGEKLGRASQPRPQGPLVWLHAVGLGEVMALRPLIDEMRAQDPQIHVLLTSTARSSAGVIGQNLPQGAIHQYLPLDGPAFVAAFLDHWRPDLAVWSEQDLWPGAIDDIYRRHIPQAYINARITEESFEKRHSTKSLFRDMMTRFSRIVAQDPASATRLAALGAPNPQVGRSLKPAAPPLAVDEAELARLQTALAARKIWVAASTHAGDEAFVLAAQRAAQAQDPSALLILVPRVPARAAAIIAELDATGLTWAQRSQSQEPSPLTSVWLADSFGELGLWYRLGSRAFIGGTLAPVGGHNPWEAITLGRPVFHGPATHNFAADFAELDRLGLATPLDAAAPEALAAAVLTPPQTQAAQAADLVAAARANLAPLAQELRALMRKPS